MSDFFGAPITPAPDEPLVIVAEGFDPRSGPTYTYQWEGREQEIRAMQQVQINLSRKTEIKRPGEGEKRWTLQVIAGADESADPNKPLVVKWSLKRNHEQKTLWEHPLLSAALDAVTPKDFGANQNLTIQRLARMKRDFEAFIRGDDHTTKENGETIALTTDVLAAHIIVLGLEQSQLLFLEYLRARLRGAEAIPTWSWVLRKTTVITEKSNVRPNKENVGKLLTLDRLKADEGLDDAKVIGEMPAGFWLKTPCEVEGSDSGGADKWDFIQEYWQAADYEKFIYGEAVT